MEFESTVLFEPTSLKRHRHRLKGGTYDPSKKNKIEFLKTIGNLPETKMTKPIRCEIHFYCKRPKSHYKSGKKSTELKDSAPKYNTNNKDLDNMVKFVLDALNTHLYEDDCQIIEIRSTKSYSETSEGYIFFRFNEVNDNSESKCL